MDSKIIKAFIGLIAAFILVIAVFGILPQLGMKGPFENFQDIPLAVPDSAQSYLPFLSYLG